jgi:hypothetical protein
MSGAQENAELIQGPRYLIMLSTIIQPHLKASPFRGMLKLVAKLYVMIFVGKEIPLSVV